MSAQSIAGCRVLIVEDQSIVRELIKRFLLKSGINDVAEAGTAEEAWQYLSGPGGAGVTLVLTDIELPAMSGTELLWKMRASEDSHLKTLPAIALTGKLDDETAQVLDGVGISAILSKPTTPETLRVAIELALAQAALGEGSPRLH